MSRFGIIIRDNGYRFDMKYDINGVIGYDDPMETWFIMGFERNFDSAPDIWIGHTIGKTYPKLSSLLDKISRMKLTIHFIKDEDKDAIVRLAQRMGETIDLDAYDCIEEILLEEYAAGLPCWKGGRDESVEIYHDLQKKYNELCESCPKMKQNLDNAIYEIGCILLNGHLEYAHFDAMRSFLKELAEMSCHIATRKFLYDIQYQKLCARGNEENKLIADGDMPTDEEPIPF